MHLRILEIIGAISPDIFQHDSKCESFQGPKYFKIYLLVIVNRNMCTLIKCYLG